MQENHTTIDAYIAEADPAVREKLTLLRETIHSEAPDATEKFSYGMPTFFLNGNLVHFAVFKNHIGFFPGASGVAAFLDELGAYNTSKGTIQFPLDQPIPVDLVRRVVRFRLAENRTKAKKKKA